jgi:hypothetical protein
MTPETRRLELVMKVSYNTLAKDKVSLSFVVLLSKFKLICMPRGFNNQALRGNPEFVLNLI